jgi:hypothetical protein
LLIEEDSDRCCAGQLWPYPKVQPGQQRPNYGGPDAAVVEQRKPIDTQSFCEAIQSMLDDQQKYELEEGGRNLGESYSADNLGLH